MDVRRTFPVMAVLALALGACSAGAAEPVPDQATQADLAPVVAYRTFTATTVTEDGTPRSLASDTPITIAFRADELTAEAGCNTLAGPYAVEERTLVVGALASTRMACDQALMDQDQWLSTFLTGKPGIDAAGDGVVLFSGSTAITLTPVETVGRYDTPVFGEEALPKVEALCARLVADGATEQQAQAAAEEAGYRFRVTVRDGQALPATEDYVPGRVNVEVAGGVVTACTAG